MQIGESPLTGNDLLSGLADIQAFLPTMSKWSAGISKAIHGTWEILRAAVKWTLEMLGKVLTNL